MATTNEGNIHNPNLPPRGPGFFKRVEGHIQGKTLGSLMELVPLLVTIFVVAFVITKVDGILTDLPFVEEVPGLSAASRIAGGFIDLALIIILLYLSGLVITTSRGRRGILLMGRGLNRVPVIRNIYGVTQQAMASLTASTSFTRVAFIEWPRDGMLAIGFVTGFTHHAENPDLQIAIVYIPTVPNPTSGNLALVNADDLIETDLTVEDAMRLVFSGGIVLPDAISMVRMPRMQDPHRYEYVGRFLKNPD